MSEGPVVPAGQHPPFAVVTENDHRAWILVAAAMGLSFVLVTLLVRVYIRSFVSRGWAHDDTLIVISTALSFVQSSIILAACSYGLGKSINLIPLSLQDRVQQLYYASNLIYLPTVDLSRISTLLFLRRLSSPGSSVERYCNFLLLLLPVSTIAFMLAAALQCDLSEPWILVHQKCPGWFLRWEIQGALSCAYEVAIFVAPVWLVWDLQNSITVKMEVVGSFAFRLITIIFTGIRLGAFDAAALTTDPFLHEALYICWTQTEMNFSIIATTIPTARRFVLDLITYYNSGRFEGRTSRSGTYGVDSFPLGSLNPGSKVARSDVVCAGPSHQRSKSDSNQNSNSNESEEMIIRRDVTFDVQHEPSS